MKALRISSVLLIPFGSLLLYIWLWVFTPKVSAVRKYRAPRIATAVTERRDAPTSAAQKGISFALALFTAAAVMFAVQNEWISLKSDWVGASLLIIGIVLIWLQSASVKNWKDPMVLGLTGTGIVAVLAGVTILILGGGSGLLPGLLLGLALIAMLGLAFSPLLLKMSKELSSSEIARVRESERADIAAHLHDSVLQTLTLIKNNANDPASVRTLALKQERELRAWLYTGVQEENTSTRRLLETSIARVEEMYGTEIEVVTVGDRLPGANEQAAIAAAVEATKNAVRHGSPPIQIYAEMGVQYDIFVKDGGPGFALENVPEDRHGVRDSIIARTERVGGRAKIRTLNPGTEIHISVPLTETVNK